MGLEFSPLQFFEGGGEQGGRVPLPPQKKFFCRGENSKAICINDGILFLTRSSFFFKLKVQKCPKNELLGWKKDYNPYRHKLTPKEDDRKDFAKA